ncbi:ABC transporter substrate-binding protein [Kineosporia sp. J2-2]|uniref:Thiamine pyrimidine synthase n=1 Tax=Kineosporia corallincola TaxID=2835133 RepID=A0ABS5TPV4_9ACTN|nr:ABC transporter substrate-binding protein [Kineosporia corallincola]MBT0773137.1 ABC transporter substrate-binding protein [Kineosporia corallincola]
MSPRSLMSRNGSRGLLAVVATAGLLAACGSGSSDSADGTSSATLQLGWIANVENAGPYTALDKGYYEAEGVDLTITPGGPSTTVEPLVASGKALVGLSSVDVVARAVAEGAPLKIIAATLQTNPTSIMSLADNPVNTLADLKGKKLCSQTSGQSVINAVLTANDIDPDDVTMVPADYDPAPLVAGDCDAFVSVLNNQPLTLKAQGVETKTFTLSDYGYNAWGNVLFTTDEALADDDTRKTLEGIVKGTAKGWSDAIADTDAAAQLMVDGPGKDQNLDLDQQKLAMASFVDLIQTDETETNGLLTMSADGIKGNVETMQQLDVPGDDLSSLFDTSILDAVYADGTDL